MLVLDASNSMLQGDKFASATAAVDAFLSRLPTDVRIGLVPFAGDLGEVIEPTTDHDAVRAALDGHHPAQGHRASTTRIAAGLDQVGDRRVAIAAGPVRRRRHRAARPRSTS